MTVTVVGTPLELNETTSTTSRTLTMPTVQDGDLGLFFACVSSMTNTITLTDNGLAESFAEVDTPAAQSGQSTVVWAVENLQSGDSGKTITITTSAAAKLAGGLVILRGAATSGAVNAYAKKTAGFTTTPTTPVVVGTAVGAAVVTFVGQARGGVSPNSTTADPNTGQGVVEVFDAFTGGSASFYEAVCVGLDVTGLGNGATYPAKTYTFDQSALYSAWSLVIKPGNQAPIVDAGPDQEVLSGATVNLSGTATDVDGSVSSVAWTVESYPEHYLDDPPTITDADELDASFDATVPGKYILRLTATDDLGATAYDEVTIWSCTTTARVYAVHTAGGWTQYGSADSIPAALRDDSDTTGAQSPNNPSNAATVYYLDPMPVGSKTISGRANLDGSGSGSLTLTLKQGNGVTVSTDTVTGLTGTTAVPFSFALSSGENGAVTDPHEMTITVSATASA